MNRATIILTLCLGAAARADLITNGGFESGFTGWVRADQAGSVGIFQDQTGTVSPATGQSVPAPPQGLHAAMTDAAGPGSHVLYQDIVIPASVPGATVQFSVYIKNLATAFSTPATLDFATPTLNQQARVDVITTAANPFSVGAADVLQNLFQTAVGSPLVTGYNVITVDVTSVLAANAGQTLRLRFAETDNVNIFNFGVDNVSLNVVPGPGSFAAGLAGMLVIGRRRRS